jgi:hypothetical protein
MSTPPVVVGPTTTGCAGSDPFSGAVTAVDRRTLTYSPHRAEAVVPVRAGYVPLSPDHVRGRQGDGPTHRWYLLPSASGLELHGRWVGQQPKQSLDIGTCGRYGKPCQIDGTIRPVLGTNLEP